MKLKITGFASGILSLLISQILIKIFGVMYSLYMTNKSGFGDTGNAIYMSGYQIYALLLTISSIGVPNSISKLISEKDSFKDYKNSNRIFYVGILIFSIIGFIGCLFLFIFSGLIANRVLLIPEARLSLMVLSPAILFVSITSVIRGYCNGEKKIHITAKSQFFEQVLKSIFTIVFVEIIYRKYHQNIELIAASANFATTVATFFSLVFIIISYKLTKNKVENIRGYYFPKEKINNIIKNIIRISFPITLSAILTSFGKSIDSVTIVRILKKYFSEEIAIKKYGIISSKVDILINFPLSFNTAITTALIPEIARKVSQNDINGVINRIKLSIFISLLISIPATFGMFFYSKEIFLILFPNAMSGAELLRVASISIIFSSLAQTLAGILQGLSKNSIPLYSTVIGIISKMICNIVFINMNGIYEKGAIIGNISLNVIIFLIEYMYLVKFIKIDMNVLNCGFQPLLFSIIMIAFTKKVYHFLIIAFTEKVAILISILICVIIYFGLVLVYFGNPFLKNNFIDKKHVST